jgi:hypothetical protein
MTLIADSGALYALYERDFRAVVPRHGRPFTLVPADER